MQACWPLEEQTKSSNYGTSGQVCPAVLWSPSVVKVTSPMMLSGLLSHRATLVGSTEGITCIDFSKMVGLTVWKVVEVRRLV